jgi:peptidoglycan/LPS O-acetylase OafA/YrhL
MTMDFTLLRLLLALSVVFAHYAALTGAGPAWLAWGLSSTVAVQAFFVVSGWIVTASCEASSSNAAFLVRRLARLYPLYAAVVVAQTVAVLALQGWGGNAGEELVRYLAANLGFANFLKPTLLGFLDGAKVEAINPSLWTMKVEVAFYLSVPLLVMLNRRFGVRALVALFVASTLFVLWAEPLSAELAKQLPGQLRFFVAGMLGRVLMQGVRGQGAREGNRLDRGLLAAAGIAGLMLAQHFDRSHAAAALQPLFVLAAVTAAAVLLPAWRRMPDISFGVYLLHAPLIQFNHQLGWFAPGTPALAAVLALTLLLALAASFLIERPAIRAGARWSQRFSDRGRSSAPSPNEPRGPIQQHQPGSQSA